MKNYISKIKPISPFLTPIESDTLFGHICWAMTYLNRFPKPGDLENFLSRFDEQEPPLIMSSAFPAGFLPFPLLPPFSIEEKKELEKSYLEKGKGDRFEFIQWLKALSKQHYISVDTFKKNRNNFSKYDLYTAVLNDELTDYRFSEPQKLSSQEKDSQKYTNKSTEETLPEDSQTIEIYHNAINRISGTVIEGKLFSNKATFYETDVWLEIYIKTDYFTPEELKDILSFIGRNGFGADKSTGSGRFELKIIEETQFEEIEDFNAYLLLSNTHPSILENHEGYYTTQTKFGKIGGIYSTNSSYSPLKTPVILLNPGSVIRSQNATECIGKNFKDIHPQLPDIQQYGISFPVSMRLKNEI